MIHPIAIVDCNNFYASCERAFNPKLEGKPVVVLSNNDGVIVALSNEAKVIGIQGFQPLFKIKHLIDKYDVKVFSSNYALYGDMSHRVMMSLEQFSPNVEIYSIDEAFISLEGMERKDLDEYCRHIRKTVKQWTGIPVSVGIAPSKTLAKLANRRAKKNPQYDGVLNLYNKSQEEIDFHLKAVDVADVWGIGRQYSKLLYAFSIRNAYDFVHANPKLIRKKMTVQGARTQTELNGIPCINLEETPPSKKAIISSRSFGEYVIEIQDLKEAVATYVTRAAEKLRLQLSAANLLSVYLRTNPYKDSPQYHNGCQIMFPGPTDSTAEMIKYAMMGVEQIYKEGYLYQKAGVMLAGIVPSEGSQFTIFDDEDRVRQRKVTELIDKINMEQGNNTIFYAATGIKKKWKMKRELVSPSYTSDWEELLEVN